MICSRDQRSQMMGFLRRLVRKSQCGRRPGTSFPFASCILKVKKCSVVFSLVAFVLFVMYKTSELPSELWFLDKDVPYQRGGELPADIPGVSGTPLLINTTNCQVPNFPPWSVAAKRLLQVRCPGSFRGAPRCPERHPRSWSYIKDSYLHINKSAVEESGYSWNSIRCCYRVISRVKQQLGSHDMNADNGVRYSDECHPINQTKQYIHQEFIRLHCVSTSQPILHDVVYREFYAIAKIPPDKMIEETSNASKLLRSQGNDGLPSVILLGVDTMSRLNFHRTFGETIKALLSIGAVEMKGYTKVGDTTLPNTAAFFSGYHLKKLRTFCNNTAKVPMDSCPFVWKSFAKLGYLTALLEDVPFESAFNKKGYEYGFIEKPTDLYIRPFMLGVMKYLRRRERHYVRCLGRRQIEEVYFEYLEEAMELASSHQIPLFADLWLATPSHECSNSAKYSDTIYSNFISKVTELHKNTILIVLGDHGEVYSEFRETVQGWYEDKLPSFWIYLPKQLRRHYPKWHNILRMNSNRLTSHFDLYKTLVHIMQTFDKEQVNLNIYKNLSSQYGQSLFQEVPENLTCDDAGIKSGYCACSAPENADVKDELSVKAGQLAFDYVASRLPLDVCEEPSLKEITKAQMFRTPKGQLVYIVTFSTDPGDFLFEGTVKVLKDGTKLVVANDVLRVNKMKRRADCVSESLLEKYCYCK